MFNAKLQDLARHFRIQGSAAHRALGDVETTLALLATQLPDQGRTALGHLIAKKLPATGPPADALRRPGRLRIDLGGSTATLARFVGSHASSSARSARRALLAGRPMLRAS